MRERDISPDIFYSNSNIFPKAEYEKRLDTIRDYADSIGVALIADGYDNESWKKSAQRVFIDTGDREQRCRLCYRARFERSAEYAKGHGYDALGTTLSVSPYQYTRIIAEELGRACEKYGLTCVFEDYSPFYRDATRRSREAGMYRQSYCGCAYSIEEAKRDRERMAAEKRRRTEANAKKRAEEEAELGIRRAAKAEYEQKQRRKHEILREMRMRNKQDGNIEAG